MVVYATQYDGPFHLTTVIPVAMIDWKFVYKPSPPWAVISGLGNKIFNHPVRLIVILTIFIKKFGCCVYAIRSDLYGVWVWPMTVSHIKVHERKLCQYHSITYGIHKCWIDQH